MHERILFDPSISGDVWPYWFLGANNRPHRHDELELNLVTCGNASYLVDDTSVTLVENTLIWLFPEQTHVLYNQSRDFEMWIAVVRPDTLDQFCTDPFNAPLRMTNQDTVFCKRLSPQSASGQSALCNSLIAERINVDLKNAGITFAVLSLWKAYCDVERHPEMSRLNPHVEQAVRLITDENDCWNLEEIADKIGISSTRLGILFRRQIGITMVQFKNEHRITRAMRMIGSPNHATLLDIAMNCGFGSYTQFYRVFKSLTGQSPDSYATGAAKVRP